MGRRSSAQQDQYSVAYRLPGDQAVLAGSLLHFTANGPGQARAQARKWLNDMFPGPFGQRSPARIAWVSRLGPDGLWHPVPARG